MHLIVLSIGFGLVTASILAMGAVGFTLQFGVTNLFNLAFGEMMTVADVRRLHRSHHRRTEHLVGVGSGRPDGMVVSFLIARFVYLPFINRGDRPVLDGHRHGCHGDHPEERGADLQRRELLQLSAAPGDPGARAGHGLHPAPARRSSGWPPPACSDCTCCSGTPGSGRRCEPPRTTRAGAKLRDPHDRGSSAPRGCCRVCWQASRGSPWR